MLYLNLVFIFLAAWFYEDYGMCTPYLHWWWHCVADFQVFPKIWIKPLPHFTLSEYKFFKHSFEQVQFNSFILVSIILNEYVKIGMHICYFISFRTPLFIWRILHFSIVNSIQNFICNHIFFPIWCRDKIILFYIIHIALIDFPWKGVCFYIYIYYQNTPLYSCSPWFH